MNLSIISFTENGIRLSEMIAKRLREVECFLFTKCSIGIYKENEETVPLVDKNIAEWAKEQMAQRNTLLFIGACGIAVRAIAPNITDKFHDSPVLVMDEKGQYVIPILAGHMGGANELAFLIAEKTGAVPVITTATDINHKFAVDIFAKKNGLSLVNKDMAAKISAKVLSGKTITISVEPGHIENASKIPKDLQLVSYPPTESVDVVITSEKRKFDAPKLLLRPKEYIIGMGCKKGKEFGKIEAFIKRSIEKLGISTMQIAALASVDLKSSEPGFLTWSRKENIPFITFSAEELQCVKGDFHRSDFVNNKVGVDNVCERAALKACGTGGILIYEKHAQEGMTIAIAKREWRVNFTDV